MADDQSPAEAEEQRNWSTIWFRIYFTGIFLLFAGLVGRLAYLQLFRETSFAEAREDQTHTVREQPAVRGNIYDASGRLLSTSARKRSIYADPGLVEKPAKTAKVLHRILGVDQASLGEKLKREKDRFVWVKRKVKSGLVKKVQSRSLRGIRVREEYERVYPHGSLASHVLGFVGDERRGLAGVEKVYNEPLSGSPGRVFYLRDGTGKLMYRPTSAGRDPVPGAPLTLTLHLGVQEAAERALKQTIKKFDAGWGSLVAMNPENGAVLAMANQPSFEPGAFQSTSASNRRNRAITDPVEPGSSFKPIVMAAGIEKGLVKPETRFDCENGSWSYKGRTIHDYKSFGTLTAKEIIEQSSNIGMAKIGLKIGKELRPWVRRFDFGERTGIALPGEAPGKVQSKKQWNPIYTQTSVPMGHEILTTPLQMVRSYCILANGGFMVKPRIVKKGGGQKVMKQRTTGRRVIRRETATTLLNMMEAVVEQGTGTPVQSDQINIAGKSGTSRKYAQEERYLSVFIGVAPVSDPQIVVGVFVDEPQGEHAGGKVAGPVVKKVIEGAIQHLENLEPQKRSARAGQIR